MARVFNNMARYVDQGGGKRKGAWALYLEPWHADIFDFLELPKKHGTFTRWNLKKYVTLGAEELRARDIFYGLWICDLFMKRVEANGKWSLFCPHEAPGLIDCWGPTFEKLYQEYETQGKARQVVKYLSFFLILYHF